MTFYITHLGDVRVRSHKLHFCLSGGNTGGEHPVLSIALSGPNGSASGFGPKTFPLQEALRKRHNARLDARAEKWWNDHACAYCKGDDDADECGMCNNPHYQYPRVWSNSVRVRLPYLGWKTIRRIPSSRARKAISSAQYRVYAKLYGSLRERSRRLVLEAQAR